MLRPVRISLIALALITAGCRDSSGPDGVFGCDSVVRYEIGETVDGSILASDCDIPGGGGNVDFYQFRQAASGPVSVLVEVPLNSVPMYFALFDSREDLVDEMEIFPGEDELMARYLDEGTYVIAIASEADLPQNSYRLSSSASIRFSDPPFLECAESQAYTLGATVTGMLDAEDDCLSSDGSLLDRYQLTLATARAITIDLMSNDVDAFLYVFNAEGAIVARNDDSGLSLDSRIRVTLPAGTYSIGATSLGYAEGAYTLRAQ